ncbi:hypothetical protein VTN96DRAFT_3345 [Rasamsonia emersonii]
MTTILSLLIVFGFFALQQPCEVAATRGPTQVMINKDISVQSETRNALLASLIIPDVLDDFLPQYSLQITYPATHTTVQLGNQVQPSQVHSTPVFDFRPLGSSSLSADTNNKTFTLILTDPDARSRKNPDWSEMCHWIVTNITSPELVMPGNPDRSPTPAVLKTYLPPGPPKGTGWHRYVFVLLAGDANEARNLQAPKDRKHWGYGRVRHGIRDWAQDNKLKILSANFFYSMSGNDTSNTE